MKKLFLIIALCLIPVKANAGLFTYIQASDASNKAQQTLNQQEEIYEKLVEIEKEQQEIKELLVLIKEELEENKKDE